MKTFAIATVAALASVGAAQLSNIPTCALSCFLPALQADGCSSITDFKCHCEKGATLIGSVQPCVQGACSASDQAAAIAAVQKTCSDAGVPIEIPGAGAASSAAAPAASSAAAAVSSAAAAVSSYVASVTSAAGSAASSAAGAASSHAASMTSNMTAPTSATPSASQFTGAAAQATQAVGLLGAAALAMLAL